MSTLNPSIYPADDQVRGAGILSDGTPWFVSGVAPDTKECLGEDYDGPALRLRIGVYHDDYAEMYRDVGGLFLVDAAFSHRGNHWRSIIPAYFYIGLDNKRGLCATHGSSCYICDVLVKEFPNPKNGLWEIDGTRHIQERTLKRLGCGLDPKLVDNSEQWVSKKLNPCTPAHTDAGRDLWQCQQAGHQYYRLVVGRKGVKMAEPEWNAIHAVRVVMEDEKKKVLYVAQRGVRVYLVEVAL